MGRALNHSTVGSFHDLLRRPTPIGTLVFLRIALGLLGGGDILGNGIYYHWYLGSFAGFTFPYLGFGWVQPLPEPWLSLYFVGGFLLGLCVAAGYRFRITAPLFALSFTYLFLLEKAHYLNHAYLFAWLAWVLALTPAWREWSVDVWRRPREWRPVAPAWSVYVFPFLMGLVYFFGGINKINYDWLIEAMPLHLWLQSRAEMPVLGPLWEQKVTAYVMAWGGMLLDLLAPFLLLHRTLRWVALGLLLGFHATNHLIFNIGIFPYLSLVLTSLFFAPDWPNRFVDWLARRLAWVRRWRRAWRARVGGVGAGPREPEYGVRLVLPLLVVITLVHVALPLRHRFFASDVGWSEEGHRYSWRMMLRSKQGYGNFRLVDRRTGREERVRPADSLDFKQSRKLMTHPDMILQYAHHLRDVRAAAGQDVAVYADIHARLNGRDYVRYIDPTVDLGRTEWTWFGSKPWILAEDRGQ